ncbi:MAG: UbiA family prenyltransferase, partial [Acidobacteria bacterium]|nr:UbiA family prenyltransferase [Acidobacteriota bacterium]MBU1475105.1 UbiA family prenyltransferase [Acidobacteriota bacterium]
MNAYLEAMRLERWPRSTAIFFGMAAFFFLNEARRSDFSPAELFLRLIASFLLTWGISTANYIINEIVDAPYDAHHPTKKNRPLVRGKIKKSPFLLMGVLLTVTCLGTACIF